MPPRELYASQIEIRPVNSNGTYGKPIELDSFGPFVLEEAPLVTPTSDTIRFSLLRSTPITLTGELKLPHKKMSSKTFKKWLMSKGFNRNLAEWFCIAVKSFHGERNYQYLYFNGLFSSTPQDLVNILFDTLFPITNNKETEE